MRDLTLRDARRVALATPYSPHGRFPQTPPYRWWTLVDTLRPLGYTAQSIPVQAELDRLISVHGPRALLRDVLARPSASAEIGGSPMSPAGDGALEREHQNDDVNTKIKTDVAREDAQKGERDDDDAEQITASAPAPCEASEDGMPRPEDHDGEEQAEPAAGAQAGSAHRDEPLDSGCPTGNGAAEADTGSATEPSQRGAGEVTENPDGSGSADTPGRDAPGGAGAAAQEHQEKIADTARSEGRPVTELRDTPGDDAPVEQHSAHADGENGEGDVADAARSPGAVKGTSRGVPVVRFGGDFGLSEAVLTCTKAVQKSARDVERALRRLISHYDVGLGDPSPRIDGRRLAAELVSRRYQLSRATRREIEPAIVVLAVDVSGSCSAACAETQIAAAAIARELPDVLVLWHSNGYVVEALGTVAASIPPELMRGPWAHGDWGGPRIDALVGSLRTPVAAVVAWGDWDAGQDYQALCEAGADLYWLDSYAACNGPKPASPNLRSGATGWRRTPAGWWQGINDAARTARAVRAMVKSLG